MTPIAPHISTFLRERLPHQRGASPHTCDSYAYSFQLLFEFASQRLGLRPSALTLEQIDAQLVMDFLHDSVHPSLAQRLRLLLRSRRYRFTTRDVHNDPSASAVLFGRLGRVAVPAVQVGERLLVGYDPVQLARFLPPVEGEQPPVSFGAAVRSVTPELARERGLPAPWGVEVGPVRPDTPAAAAGIRTGDVITGVGAYTLAGGADQFRTAGPL